MSDSHIFPLAERFPCLTERPSADHPAFNCPAANLIEVVTAIRDEFGYDLLLDVTAVDWDKDSPRFTGFYHFLSSVHHTYLRLAVACASDEEPSLPTLSGLFPAADWHERETFDLMGIHYEGHPDLRRILMWDDYPYHPLRKEFPLAGIEVPLPAADVAETTKATVAAAPMMGGPFVAKPAGTSVPSSSAEPRAEDESWTEKRHKPGD